MVTLQPHRWLRTPTLEAVQVQSPALITRVSGTTETFAKTRSIPDKLLCMTQMELRTTGPHTSRQIIAFLLIMLVDVLLQLFRAQQSVQLRWTLTARRF